MYPSEGAIDFVLKWANQGWNAARDTQGDRGDFLAAISLLIRRLELPAEYEMMRREVLRGGTGVLPKAQRRDRPRPELLTTLTGNLRLNGYIYRESGAQPWRRVPLTVKQTHYLHLVARGNTCIEVASLVGLRKDGVRDLINIAMRLHGVPTMAGLVGRAVYEGWFPNRAETQFLTRTLAHVSRGYTTRTTT